jgi:hypothetical protein
VIEIFVGRVERVVNLEGTAGFGKVAVDLNIPKELPG